MRRRLTPARLRLFLGLLWVAVSVPTAVLVVQTQRQMKWEAYYQYRSLADELAQRIDGNLQQLTRKEEARSYADYQFLVVTGNPERVSAAQRSPLAEFPVRSDIPGLLGYFQVDSEGHFSTPLLPDTSTESSTWGLSHTEVLQRAALRDRLFGVLSSNRLVQQRSKLQEPATSAKPPPAVAPLMSAASTDIHHRTSAQEAFDQLKGRPVSAHPQNTLGQLKDLKLEHHFQDDERKKEVSGTRANMEPTQKSEATPRGPRKEQSAQFEAEHITAGKVASTGERARVHMFESEIDPFDFVWLDSGHFVLFRKAWRNGKRTIQGAIIEQVAFLNGALRQPFQETTLAQMSNLLVAYQGNILRVIPGRGDQHSYPNAEELEGTQLFHTRLSAPLDDLHLLWTITRLPASPGAGIVNWTSVLLFGVLTVGVFLVYRLGLRQIILARQQQDFVSAVSHELKSPLTSIRMYGEMLREGWVSEAKKREYYEFIHDESERLSRLITNVLQLASLERNDLRLALQNVPVATLMDLLHSKVNGQIERAGFLVRFQMEEACAEHEVRVDPDAFTQIIINLVDNAVKFSARAHDKTVNIGVRCRGAQTVV